MSISLITSEGESIFLCLNKHICLSLWTTFSCLDKSISLPFLSSSVISQSLSLPPLSKDLEINDFLYHICCKYFFLSLFLLFNFVYGNFSCRNISLMQSNIFIFFSVTFVLCLKSPALLWDYKEKNYFMFSFSTIMVLLSVIKSLSYLDFIFD